MGVVLLLHALLIISCSSSDNGTDPPEPYDVGENMEIAWQRFASGDYSEALAKFDEILYHSTDNPEALMGKGWCFAFQAEYDYAIIVFQSAIDNDLDTPDVRIGLASVYRDYHDYSAGLSNAESVIDADSLYQFSRRTTIDYKDAHLIIAECAYYLGSSYYPTAHEAINYLCDLLGIAPLPDAGSIPGDEYEMQMVQKIDDLTDLIAD